jgi:hypothetical protein
MTIVLQVLGVMFLLLILFVVFVVLVIRAKLRGFARNLEGFASSMTAAQTPARIHLRPMAAPSWEDAEAIESQAAPLPDLGFTKAGDYQVEEIPGLSLEAWVNPDKAVTAVVYEHPVAGVWTDMVTRYEDGSRATFANTAQGGGVDHAPGHTVERFAGIGSKELYHRHLAQRPDRPVVVPTAEGFLERFETAYADEMDWRNSRGGTTEAEIREIARLAGQTYDENVIAATRQMAQARAMVQLDEAIRERFLKETTLPASEWEGLRDRVFAVHDRMTQEAFEEAVNFHLEFGGEEDEEGVPQIDGSSEGSPRRLFARLNAEKPEAKRCRKLGEVTQPVAADVYAAPEPEEE